jgi:glycosyltransferase involved in cell wall biosynthesis
MIIGVDGNEANIKQRVGVNIYTYKLISYFNTVANRKNHFIIYLKKNPLSDMPKENEYFTYRVIPGLFFWSRINFPLYLAFFKPDVLFCPAHYIPPFLSIPSVVTIHDLSYEYYPEEFKKKDLYTLKNWTSFSVKKAKKIISVSENTKRDISRTYNIKPTKISVIYNGNQQQKNENTNKYAIDISKPYILYIGTIQPRKNIERLIEAFSKLVHKNQSVKLVIAGKKGWLHDDIFASAIKFGVHDKVSFLGYVDDNTKSWLYKNASLFILPSLYEGFGLPLLEAMSYGCPVVTSNTSSLPEIGGNACYYFNPKSISDMTKAMDILLNDKILCTNLVQNGYKRIKEFSWKKCAEETLDLIKNQLN